MPSEYRLIRVAPQTWVVGCNIAAVSVTWDYDGIVDPDHGDGYWLTIHSAQFPSHVRHFDEMRDSAAEAARICERIGPGRFVHVAEGFWIHPPHLGALRLLHDPHGVVPPGPRWHGGWWVVGQTSLGEQLYLTQHEDEEDAASSLARIAELVESWQPPPYPHRQFEGRRGEHRR